jgi:hypothetical protein
MILYVREGLLIVLSMSYFHKGNVNYVNQSLYHIGYIHVHIHVQCHTTNVHAVVLTHPSDNCTHTSYTLYILYMCDKSIALL